MIPEDGYNIRFAQIHDPTDDYMVLHTDIVEELRKIAEKYTDTWRVGVLFRWGSIWVGAHWSGPHKRLCVNFVPFVTVWVTAPGGDVP
jgi:hypothetical protein